MSNIFAHNGAGFTPDGSIGEISQSTCDMINQAADQAFVTAFKAHEYRGPLIVYLSTDGKSLTTWIGTVVATVTSTGRTIHGFGGSKLVPFRATGIDGNTWYGRHNGGGAACTMRMAKPKQSAAQRGQHELCVAARESM
jgi:hypothetical protein